MLSSLKGPQLSKQPPVPWGIPKSLGNLSSLGNSQLPEGSPGPAAPRGWGGGGIRQLCSLHPLSLFFCHFCSCCCNKRWEKRRLPLPPAPLVGGGAAAAGAGFGGGFEDKQPNYGQMHLKPGWGCAECGCCRALSLLLWGGGNGEMSSGDLWWGGGPCCCAVLCSNLPWS